MGFNDQQNKRIANFIIDKLLLNPISDDIPKKVNNIIQPVFEVNREIANFARHGAQTTSGTITIATTSANKDTYLQSVYLSIAKDATSDLATGSVQVQATIQGTVRRLLDIATITLTAQSEAVSISFPAPLKIDRNTAIQVGGTFTAGVLTRMAGVTGFEEDTGDVTPA